MLVLMKAIRIRFRQGWRGFLVEPDIVKNNYTAVNTGNPISHRIHARQFGVGMSQ
jgi:hypothetical protein